MNYVVVEFRVNAELYKEAEVVLAQVGLTMQEAVTLFFQATIACGTLPFQYTEDDLATARAMETEMDI